MLHVLLQRRHELEKTRNAWAVACKNRNDFEIEYEDYDIPSASEDSGSSGDSVSDGWEDHSSEDKDDDEDEEDEDQCEDTSKSSAAKNVRRKRPRCRCPLKGRKCTARLKVNQNTRSPSLSENLKRMSFLFWIL